MRDFWLLSRQNGDGAVRAELDEAIAEIVDSNQFIFGPVHEACEQELAEAFGVEHAVLVSSGTSALIWAMRAFKGRKAILWDPFPVSFVATRNACLEMNHFYGARETLSVDLYGLPAKAGTIRDSCQAHNLALMKMLPGDSHAACLSFFPTKAIGAFGDAGAVLTNDPDLAADVRCSRDHGRLDHSNASDGFGVNARCDAIQAAVIRVKLRHFPQWQRKRIEICREWDSSTGYDHAEYGPYLYPVWSEDRDGLKERLEAASIPSKIYYPRPLWPREDAQRFCDTVLCLNPDPFLTDDEAIETRRALIRERFIERPRIEGWESEDDCN